MYSKNDYRYYLENQLAHSDDYLAHYGVKGMKWRKHKVRNSIFDPEVWKREDGDFKNGHKVEYSEAKLKPVKKSKAASKRYKTAKANTEKRAAIEKGRQESRKKQGVAEKRDAAKWHKKSSYIDEPFNHETTISSTITNNTTGETTHYSNTYETYGQIQRKQDMKADRKRLRKNVERNNPYKVDKNKSISENVRNNAEVAKKRKRLKKQADRRVDNYYKNGK